MCRKISASVAGGPSGGSRVRRPREGGPPSALAEISSSLFEMFSVNCMGERGQTIFLDQVTFSKVFGLVVGCSFSARWW